MSCLADSKGFFVVHTAKEVKNHIQNFPADKKILVLVDVDDVLITPQSLTFRSPPYNRLLDEIKANPEKYPHFEDIVSNWRMQRKAMLIDKEWPQVLEDLRQKHQVFGLTKVNTGHFGVIESMEEWRYQELSSLGLSFSDCQGDTTQSKTELGEPTQNQPSFYQGIMMTGSASKEQTLDMFQTGFKAFDVIVFIDDRQKNLEEIEKYAQRQGVDFMGLHFKGLETLGGRQEKAVFDLQKETLITKKIWLSDEEARLRVENS